MRNNIKFVTEPVGEQLFNRRVYAIYVVKRAEHYCEHIITCEGDGRVMTVTSPTEHNHSHSMSLSLTLTPSFFAQLCRQSYSRARAYDIHIYLCVHAHIYTPTYIFVSNTHTHNITKYVFKGVTDTRFYYHKRFKQVFG